MFTKLFQLIILFLVIFDPLASLAVFFTATKEMDDRTRAKTALVAIFVAALISYTFLLFGQNVIIFFGSTMTDFKIASGVILGILGIEMVLGISGSSQEKPQQASSQAIAALIATPLLTGPAAITTIIITVSDPEFGLILTGTAITIVLLVTAFIFIISSKMHRVINATLTKVLTTILGLITISWGVKFIRQGLGF